MRAAHRVIFIDLARAAAVILMINGHTMSALLAPEYQSGMLFEAWRFQRGLTSTLFLLLSGFAFSIATSRHWPSHIRLSWAVFKRIRRFGLLIVLGYALHFPVGHFSELTTATDEKWRSFLGADVLQLLGVTLILLQLLVMASRRRNVFLAASLALGAAIVAVTPAVWAVDCTRLPAWLAAYMSVSSGSFFPIFPFAALVLVGAGLGQIYAHWGASHLDAFANRVLLASGAAAALLALAARLIGLEPPDATPGALVPVDFALRTGVSLVILAGIAHASQRLMALPRVFGAVAQESLVVYFWHLCVVYGSVWGPGLHQLVPPLSPIQAVPFALAVIGAMLLLAWSWNLCKHTRPMLARAIMIGTTAVLIARLL